jgi:hypothetical protein
MLCNAMDPSCHALKVQPVSADIGRGIQGLRNDLLGGYCNHHATPPAREAVNTASGY